MGAIAQAPQAADDFLTVPLIGYTQSRALAAGVAKTITVPTGARFVLFSANSDFYVKGDGAATVPGDISDGTAPVLNPAGRELTGVSSLSLIAPAACVVTATFLT